MSKLAAIIIRAFVILFLIVPVSHADMIEGDCNVIVPEASAGEQITISIACNNISSEESSQLVEILNLVTTMVGRSDDIQAQLEAIAALMQESSEDIDNRQAAVSAPRFDVTPSRLTVCDFPDGVYWTGINCNDTIEIISVGGHISRLPNVQEVTLLRVTLLTGDIEYWSEGALEPITISCPFDQQGEDSNQQIVFPLGVREFYSGNEIESGEYVWRVSGGVLVLLPENEIRRASEIFARMYESRGGKGIDPDHVVACTRAEMEIAIKVAAANYSGVVSDYYIGLDLSTSYGGVREDGTEIIYVEPRLSESRSRGEFFNTLLSEHSLAQAEISGPAFSNDPSSAFAQLLMLQSFGSF